LVVSGGVRAARHAVQSRDARLAHGARDKLAGGLRDSDR
jgi:hypothetical protein